MCADYRTPRSDRQGAHRLHAQLITFLGPLLRYLDDQIDARLVRTFVATLTAILTFRHRAHGLLLSELGGYILSPDRAPAGTKRLSNLLRSPKWASTLIVQWLWTQASQRVTALTSAGEDALVVWDESVLEKAETLTSDDLCAVRSSKARRLKRIRPGFFNPPGGQPICVPGLEWLGLLVLGRVGPPTVAAMQWWTRRGRRRSTLRTEEYGLLARCVQAWGRQVIHVWDRGFAGGPWLSAALEANVRFVLRWQKGYQLLDGAGEERKAWQIARGKRSWGYRWLDDPRRGEQRKVGVLALPVTHPEHARPIWLVVARPGNGQEPWYLITADPIRTEAAAWQVVFAYARRWQIELTWRYSKSELAMESPRVWAWERRLRLLLLVTLAYAFLLALLDTALDALRQWLLRQWCHRTGRRLKAVAMPLYRLRAALSRLWLAIKPPSRISWEGNPG
jgi:hypothetical protein